MSNTMLALKRKIASADDLHSVVRSMKSIAGSNISQYEQAIKSLNYYYRTIELGLIASLHNIPPTDLTMPPKQRKNALTPLTVGVVIFGTDQGLVGQFNQTLLAFMRKTLADETVNAIFWPVGERMQIELHKELLSVHRSFTLPRQIPSITSLITDLLVEIEAQKEDGAISQVFLFFNNPVSNTRYSPEVQKLLPLDKMWQQKLASQPWQGRSLPELVDGKQQCLVSLIHEYLFVSLFKSCVASLASENASRLTAMQRAEKNIDGLKNAFSRSYQIQRQSSIDEELFDLVSGFEAMHRHK